MSKFKKKMINSSFFIVFIFVMLLGAKKGIAQINYQIPSNITIEMNVLISSGAKKLPLKLCNSSPTTRQSFGCTFYPDDVTHQYPFTSDYNGPGKLDSKKGI